MKISSAQYRNWSIDEWCAHVRALDVTTLTGWATTARSSYNHAVTLGCQRDVARALGWLPKLDTGEMVRLSDEEFIQRFRDKGVESISDMWRAAQHWCEYLRREERLEGIAAALGFGYRMEWHPPELEYYLERCRRVGDFTAWCQLDRNAAAAARKFGLMGELRKRAPKRPRRGYPTAGGYCRSLPELALARLLEANGIAFVTQLDYPFTFPRGKRHHSKCDFYLTEFGAFIEVWSVYEHDKDAHWEQYQVRRNFKTVMCRKLNLRLLDIEGQMLFRQGIDAYLQHAGAVLSEAGLILPNCLDKVAALTPQYVPQIGGKGG